MTQYIKGRDGKFAGSIGDGKTSVPVSAPSQPGRHLKAVPDIETQPYMAPTGPEAGSIVKAPLSPLNGENGVVARISSMRASQYVGHIYRDAEGYAARIENGQCEFACAVQMPGVETSTLGINTLLIQGQTETEDNHQVTARIQTHISGQFREAGARTFATQTEANTWLASVASTVHSDLNDYTRLTDSKSSIERLRAKFRELEKEGVFTESLSNPRDPIASDHHLDLAGSGRHVTISHQKRLSGDRSIVRVTDERLGLTGEQTLHTVRFADRQTARLFALAMLAATYRTPITSK